MKPRYTKNPTVKPVIYNGKKVYNALYGGKTSRTAIYENNKPVTKDGFVLGFNMVKKLIEAK